MNAPLLSAPVSAKQLRAAALSQLQVAPPTRADFAAANGVWWPQLFLKKGRVLQAVTPAQASAVVAEIRDRMMNDGQGASDFNPVKLYTEDGFRAGHVSWNGSVWIHDEESGNDTEIPLT